MSSRCNYYTTIVFW